MSQLDSKSSCSTLRREYGQGEKQTLQKIKEQYMQDNRYPVILFVPKYFTQSRTCIRLIFRDNLSTSHKNITIKEIEFGL